MLSKKSVCHSIGVLFALIVLFFIHNSYLYSQEYIWSSTKNGLWNAKANWTPASDYPRLLTDKAVFNASSVFNCNLSQNAAISELLIDTGYTGTLALIGFFISPELKADVITVRDGNIISGGEKIIANNFLYIEGGNSVDLTSDGDTSMTGGIIGILNMRGPDSNLYGTGSSPQEIGSLKIKSSICTVHDTFIAGILQVNETSVLQLAQQSILTTTLHSIAGTISLSPLSALVFASGCNVSGTIDVSQFGGMIVCNGNWKIPGKYINSGYPINLLTINQSLIGTTIDHGDNEADAVFIQNDAGRKSTWLSSNTIQQLTVNTTTTLEIASGAVLSVEGSIINREKIIEVPPGHIHHEATILQPVSDLYIPLRIIMAGQSFRVFLVDGDENLEAKTNDIAEGITITNTRNGDSLKIAASETDIATNSFRSEPVATIKARSAVDDNVLQVLSGDTIIIEYVDNEDPEDNTKAAVLRVLFSLPVYMPRGIVLY